jgi:hypothetical protein
MPIYVGHLREVSGPVDPGFGGGLGGPADPGYGHPEGGHPSHGLPPIPGAPDQGLPAPPPGIWPPPSVSHPIEPAPPGTPPGTIWPSPGEPTHPVAPPSGGAPTPTPPIASKVYWIVAGIPGVGWRYVAVDPSLRPDQGLPPGATPKA